MKTKLAAEFLGLPLTNLYQKIGSGSIGYSYIDGKIDISAKDISDFIAYEEKRLARRNERLEKMKSKKNK